jgi:PPM family protein phosphatase
MITFFGATTKGRIREKNEDSFLIAPSIWGYPYIFAVADGIGGLNAGEIASRTAVEHLEETFSANDFRGMKKINIDRIFKRISEEINKKLAEISESDEEKQGLGTTLSVLLIFKERAYISHIGDSSIFRITDKVEKLTEDHTLVNELLKKNEISESEAKNHPRRNMITKALGCGLGFEMDTREISAGKNEIYILCTDGLFNSRGYDPDVIIPETMIGKSAEEITNFLIRFADESGGRDNTTIITVRT